MLLTIIPMLGILKPILFCSLRINSYTITMQITHKYLVYDYCNVLYHIIIIACNGAPDSRLIDSVTLSVNPLGKRCKI